PAPKAWLAGLALGLGMLLWLSWADLASYAAVRQSQNLPHTSSEALQQGLAGLKGFWMGAPTLAYTGIKNNPAFPIWAWFVLLPGIFSLARERRWVLGWAALGLLALLSKNSSMEPQRAIAAWPALCLLAGAGAQSILRGRLWLLPVLALLASLGAVHETRAYAKAMSESYAQVYGPSASVLDMGRKYGTKGPGGQVQILTEFDNESSAAWRYLLSPGAKSK